MSFFSSNIDVEVVGNPNEKAMTFENRSKALFVLKGIEISWIILLENMRIVGIGQIHRCGYMKSLVLRVYESMSRSLL